MTRLHLDSPPMSRPELPSRLACGEVSSTTNTGISHASSANLRVRTSRHDRRRHFFPRAIGFRSPLPLAQDIGGGLRSDAFSIRNPPRFEDSPAEECMSKTANHAPASVAENVEKVIRVENETQRPRSRSEAITDAIW